MIHYDVRCSAGHEFDGWFKDSAAFDKQSKRGLVECPVCGDRRVERALMAPALAKRQNSRAEAVEAPAVPAAPPSDSAAPAMQAAGPMPANLIAKLAHGIADDVLTTALLAARVPVLIAPAMNDAMYENAATQENVAALRARGFEFVDPERGFLAERERGIGRLAREERLIEALERALARRRSLAGRRVAITAGPTREAFDPVRFLSNAATGAMGIELAREAALRGGDVTLLLGPTALEPPAGVRVVRVTTARDLLEAALAHAVGADLTIATAAVADWRPEHASEEKIKKSDGDTSVAMTRNPDVLAALGERKGATFLVGFAAETSDHEANAREKLRHKGLDAIAVNDVRGERGFGPGENTLTLLWGRDGRRELGTASKGALAARLLDAVEELMQCC